MLSLVLSIEHQGRILSRRRDHGPVLQVHVLEVRAKAEALYRVWGEALVSDILSALYRLVPSPA